MRKTDIIVPVCDVNSDVKRCIESIIQNSESSEYNLIVIHNSFVEKYMEILKKQLYDINLQIIFNKDENGFFELANNAIKNTDNDVVILDPSMVVTKGWLNKLASCAYRDESIATVTPLSNNGYICSVPVFNAKNIMPLKTIGIEEIAELVEQVSLKMYPELPTAVGYCMFIKRETINYVGLFDTATYGKGLGEVNDFSWRAAQFGYRHVLCDDTFLYCDSSSLPSAFKKHSGASKKIYNLYSEYIERLNTFLVENPLEIIQNRIKIFMLLKNGRKNLLTQLHYGFEKKNQYYIGGTQTAVKNIVQGLCYSYNCFVFFRDFGGFTLNAYINDELIVFKYPFNEKINKITFTNSKIAEIVRNVLNEYSIDLVHVHHVIDQTFDMIYEAHKLNIPIILSLHDYYWICPTLNLLSKENKFCLKFQNPDYCRSCLEQKMGISEYFLDRWRSKVDEAFSMCRTIITPSKSTRDIYTLFYPNIAKIIEVIPHGIEKSENYTPYEPQIMDGMNVAFVGYVTQIKGSDIAYKIITEGIGDKIKWNFFGMIQDTRFVTLKGKNLYIHGIYQRDELSSLLHAHKINLVCVLSICPETFCLVLSEVIEVGIPVLASDIGALTERVEEADCGWLIPVDATAEQVVDSIKNIQNNPKDYQKKVENIQKTRVRDMTDMKNDYFKVYERMFLNASKPLDSIK